MCTCFVAISSRAASEPVSVDRFLKVRKMCGQGNVINLFRDENKRAKKSGAMIAKRKEISREFRSRAARADFHSDRVFTQICSGSHCARSLLFESRANFLAKLRAQSISIEKKFSIAHRS